MKAVVPYYPSNRIVEYKLLYNFEQKKKPRKQIELHSQETLKRELCIKQKPWTNKFQAAASKQTNSDLAT